MATKPVNDLATGDVVLYPHQETKGTFLRPVTISGIVEYPENRVIYFAEGGYGIVSRKNRSLQVPA